MRRGEGGSLQAHPFFAGIDWDNLYETRPPYIPRVEHELDTQNFEQLEEEEASAPTGGSRRWARADPTFVGYTYKNWEAVGSSGKPLCGFHSALPAFCTSPCLSLPTPPSYSSRPEGRHASAVVLAKAQGCTCIYKFLRTHPLLVT